MHTSILPVGPGLPRANFLTFFSKDTQCIPQNVLLLLKPHLLTKDVYIITCIRCFRLLWQRCSVRSIDMVIQFRGKEHWMWTNEDDVDRAFLVCAGTSDSHPIENVTERLFSIAEYEQVNSCKHCKNIYQKKNQKLKPAVQCTDKATASSTKISSVSASAGKGASLVRTRAMKRQKPSTKAASAVSSSAKYSKSSVSTRAKKSGTGMIEDQNEYCSECQKILDRVRQLLNKREITSEDCRELENYVNHSNCSICKLDENPYMPNPHPLLISPEEKGRHDVVVHFSSDRSEGVCQMRAMGYETFCGLIYEAAKPLAKRPYLIRYDFQLYLQTMQTDAILQRLGGHVDMENRPFKKTMIPTIASAKEAEMPCWQLMGGTFPRIIGPKALQQLSKDLKKIKPNFCRIQELKTSEGEDWSSTFEDLQEVAATTYGWM